jgi:NAD(P)-dependent dehydrogenase (short-subunit alcohol dehydrogenase family)
MSDVEFPAQQQEPPGLTGEMRPQPDHGEQTYVGHGRLEGKVALVTGADSGIGRAVAIAYAREGADVAFTCLPEEREDAEQTVRLVRDAGRTALPLPLDLRERPACDEAVAPAFVFLASPAESSYISGTIVGVTGGKPVF